MSVSVSSKNLLPSYSTVPFLPQMSYIHNVASCHALELPPRFLLFSAVPPALGQWTSIGPDGGSAHVLAIDPRNPCSSPRRLPRSAALSIRRTQASPGIPWPDFAGSQELYQAALNVVAIDPAILKLSTPASRPSNSRPAAENGAGLYKSTDAGQTWTRIPSLAGVSVYCLAIWEKDRHVMVAGTNHGVYRSQDSGESWEHISPDG